MYTPLAWCHVRIHMLLDFVRMLIYLLIYLLTLSQRHILSFSGPMIWWIWLEQWYTNFLLDQWMIYEFGSRNDIWILIEQWFTNFAQSTIYEFCSSNDSLGFWRSHTYMYIHVGPSPFPWGHIVYYYYYYCCCWAGSCFNK